MTQKKEEYLKQNNLEEIDYNQKKSIDILSEAIEKNAFKIPPFEEKGEKGFKDFINIESLKEYKRKNPNTQIYFLTGDDLCLDHTIKEEYKKEFNDELIGVKLNNKINKGDIEFEKLEEIIAEMAKDKKLVKIVEEMNIGRFYFAGYLSAILTHLLKERGINDFFAMVTSTNYELEYEYDKNKKNYLMEGSGDAYLFYNIATIDPKNTDIMKLYTDKYGEKVNEPITIKFKFYLNNDFKINKESVQIYNDSKESFVMFANEQTLNMRKFLLEKNALNYALKNIENDNVIKYLLENNFIKEELLNKYKELNNKGMELGASIDSNDLICDKPNEIEENFLEIIKKQKES